MQKKHNFFSQTWGSKNGARGREVPDLGKIPTFSRFVFGRLPLMNWHCICNIGIGTKLIYKDFGLFWAKVHCCNITKYQDFKMVPSEKLVSSTNGSFPQKYCVIRDGLPDHMVQKSCHCLNWFVPPTLPPNPGILANLANKSTRKKTYLVN